MAIIEGTGGSLMGGATIFRKAGLPTTDFNGVADTGALCVDTTNKFLYINTGTLAANTWTKVGNQV